MKPEDRLAVLLRTALELTIRYHHTRTYIETVTSGGHLEYQQLGRTLVTALREIASTLPQYIGHATTAVTSNENADETLEMLESELLKYLFQFNSIHELLVYLPRHPISPEAVGVLRDVFGQNYSEQQPSITLGSLFSAVEFDFLEQLKGRIPDFQQIEPKLDRTSNIVLQLSICDWQSPYRWSTLAHEMGHAIDNALKISEGIIAEPQFSMVGAWCNEVCADLIAAKALGPAPILALISLEYCFLPAGDIFYPSESHPPTLWRIGAVRNFLHRTQGEEFFAMELKTYTTAWRFSLERAVPDETQRTEIETDLELCYELVIKPMALRIEERIRAIDVAPYALKVDSMARCVDRLKNGLPISAQGLSRPRLQEMLAEYRGTTFLDERSQIEAFWTLTRQFREDPLTPPAILFGAHERRHEILDAAIRSSESLSDPTIIQDLCNQLDQLDQLIISSLNSSAVHRRVLDEAAGK